MEQNLFLKDLTVEHLKKPLGIDCGTPRFGWKLISDQKDTCQTGFFYVRKKGNETWQK